MEINVSGERSRRTGGATGSVGLSEEEEEAGGHGDAGGRGICDLGGEGSAAVGGSLRHGSGGGRGGGGD
ncbi:unnamed protein product [Spirodela intermedia]|uniref:Uncharacterized protein n=1 Tax=Spirodela intermedia TaxID=51605 RepID=A0A7I8JFB7_SPIIN|nr:unnamed protein product [Spirodela intermedia]CAA6668233.1 unnamed protein product [Spirodela intermedia]